MEAFRVRLKPLEYRVLEWHLQTNVHLKFFEQIYAAKIQ